MEERALLSIQLTNMADYKVYPQTTPVKKTGPPPYNRRQMSDIVTRTDYLTPQNTFSEDRLNKPKSFAIILKNKKLKALVKRFSDITTTKYDLLVKLLNHTSSLIRGKYFSSRLNLLSHLLYPLQPHGRQATI